MKCAIIGDIIGSIYEFDNIKTKDFPLFGKKRFFMDPTSVQHLLGHKDLSVTMGIYNHYLEEERHENTVQLLNGALAYLS